MTEIGGRYHRPAGSFTMFGLVYVPYIIAADVAAGLARRAKPRVDRVLDRVAGW